MPEQQALAREAIAIMTRVTGRRYQALWREVEKMPVDALMDLLRFLGDFGDELEREKRTFKPFPGGPRFRM